MSEITTVYGLRGGRISSINLGAFCITCGIHMYTVHICSCLSVHLVVDFVVGALSYH